MSGSTFEFEDMSGAAIEDIEDAIESGLEAAALYTEAAIQNSMPKNPNVEAGEGGWKKSFGHRARSTPGNPPMQQTGNLVRNIISGKTGHMEYMVGTKAGYSDKPYGAFLDRGTKKMKARPWLGAMFTARKKQINAKFEEGFNRALKGDRA